MNMNHKNKKRSLNLDLNLNLFLKKYLSATILTIQAMAGMLAQETNFTEREELPIMPAQVSIVYPMTTMGDQTINYRYHLSFNLFSGKVGAIKGVEFGTIYNYAEHDVWGVQCSGIVNKTRVVTGLQFSGLINTCTILEGIQFSGLLNVCGGVTGIQFGGISNIADSVKGIQFGGIANLSKNVEGIQYVGIANVAESVKGIQFSGITNVAESVKGIQFSGISNVTEKIEGIQFSGIGNVSREVSGASFGGIFNLTETLNGIQVAGIVNVVDTVASGVPIALINIVRKGGYREWSLNFADYLNVGLSFKMGTSKFYTIFAAGANFLEDNMWVTGFGFGHRSSLGNRFDFQPEIVDYQYYPFNFKKINYLSATHLKIGFIYKLNDHLGISIAPSLYFLNGDVRRTERVGSIPPFAEWERKYSYQNRYVDIENVNRHSFGAGISVGLLLH